MSVAVQVKEIEEMLANLIGRDVTVTEADSVETHPVTVRGLVTNENQLAAVIGSDLEFAHRSGAALAMVPAGRCEDADGEPDEDLILAYREVSNVLSRLIDEAVPVRVRIDPGMTVAEEAMAQVVAAGSVLTMCEVSIEGYGGGRFGVWYRG